MQRITISLADSLADTFDRLSTARGYQSRSEAMRDAVRQVIETWQAEEVAGPYCVASFSFIYNPQTRALAQRLADLQLATHDVIAAAMSVPLDHLQTLECITLSGKTATVRAIADRIRAERGVAFASLNLVSVDAHQHHERADDHVHPAHPHLSPRNS